MKDYSVAVAIHGWAGPFDAFIELARIVERELGIARSNIRGLNRIPRLAADDDEETGRKWYTLTLRADDEQMLTPRRVSRWRRRWSDGVPAMVGP